MNPWPDTRHSLIHRLADANDRSAWEQFEQCYQSAIYRMARSRGLRSDEALDVVQEVMMAVHRLAAAWQPSDRIGSFRAWLAETTRRQTLSSLRFRGRIGETLELSHDVASRTAASPSQVDAQDERDWLFYEAIAQIERSSNPTHWMAFWLTSIEGLEPAVVAARLGLRLGSVYSIKSRILATIKDRVAELRTDPRVADRASSSSQTPSRGHTS